MRPKLIVVLLLISALTGCRFFNKDHKPDPAFGQYIEAYTSGVISKKSPIRIRFASNVSILHQQNGEEGAGVLEIGPVKGKTVWTDSRTIEFRPESDLEPGKEYSASFKLSKLVKVPENLETFDFKFQVIKPGLMFEQHGLTAVSSSSLDYMKLTGTLEFADSEAPEKIQKILSLEFPDKKLSITWAHEPATHTSRFTIDSIPRANVRKPLAISWDGDPINADEKGSETLEIPAIGEEFNILSIKAVQEPDQYVLIQFSDPILVAQDLNGLIGISNTKDLRYTIDGSEVKVYAPDRLEGDYSVVVNEGVENIRSVKIRQGMTANVNFETQFPTVSIPGNGIILPGKGKLTLAFEASNLTAVDVTIIKIYENNIPQFLQQNKMDGDNELRRVARPVTEKTIRLDADPKLNLRKKNRFSLDIDKLLRAEPGAIYRITVGFRKAYSLYRCNGNTKVAANNDDDGYYGDDDGDDGNEIDEDDDFWGRYGNYYTAGYRWSERDDPCTDSYYTRERWASRNVIASNIGLIVKQGGTKNILVAATNILSAEPMGGVEIKLLDYQQQVIQTMTTADDGIVSLDLKRKPYLLLAQKGAERGYLKLDDGSSLPLSRFNVSGDVVQNGIKGFIYGERGVWRPGDSLFISFILEDKNKKIPADLPVMFQLYNPKGQLTRQMTTNKALNGFYRFQTFTDAAAPTGNWIAKVKAGGAVFEKSLKIETVVPNRLKINFDIGDRKYLAANDRLNATLSAKWLFGATAQNLKAKVDVTLKPGRSVFEQFKSYTFDDPTGTFEPENKTVFEGSLRADGTALIPTGISESATAPGVLQANFSTKVFEPGGNFSIDNFSIPYHVYNTYAGIRLPEGDKLTGMLLTDRDNAVSIVNVNNRGELVKGQKTFSVELYKIQWRWWWDSDEENLANFTQNQYNQLLKKENITVNNGTAKWNLRINSPGWGRYLVRVTDLESGHTTGQTVYIDWPGWAQREQQSNPTEAAMLSFTANKEKYSVGEDITLTIPSSKGGRGLVSIESGSKVIKTWWIDTKQGQTTFTFKAVKEMAPNVYVNVTMLQPHSQTANDLPIRMYGVIPLLVEDQETILKPQISMPATIRPETTSAITISEGTGKPMTYTVALVDEGLLDLTRYKTPDPHASFYAREALGVKTWDLFDLVIGAWGGDLERILSIGGDGMNRNIDPAKSNRFKPVVKFLGPFHIGKGEKRTHQFKLAPYIGSVRAMVIAGENGAYGTAEKTVQVKKPLMLLATLPRMAGPTETFKLPVTVFALENNIKKVSLRIETNGLVSSSSAGQTVTFDSPGEKMAYVDVQVKNVTGLAKIRIIATSGSEKTEYNAQLDIRNPNPYITSVTAVELEAGKSWTGAITPLNTSGQPTAIIEAASIPVNLTKRLNYLIQYPHGCIEQTTSAVFPQLLMGQITVLTEQQITQVERNIKAGIYSIRNFQTPQGGLSYWPGEPEADEWGTNYGGHFMLEAQAKGYALPAGFLEQWKKFQRGKAVAWTPQTANYFGGDLTQAYRLYLLALAKSPEIGAMNRLKEVASISSEAKWRLASAYRMIGQTEIASGLIKGLSYQVPYYRQLGRTFGSDLRDQAMILETLTEMGRRTEASRVLVTVANKLSRDDWYSTQATAYSLIAIAKYCGTITAGQKLNFTWSANGQKKPVTSNATVFRVPVALNRATTPVTIVNNASNRLFIKIIREGKAPVGSVVPVKNDPKLLVMNVSYKTQSGKLINPAVLKQGTDFVAEVTIRNPGNRGFYEQMALTQIFPSGWEIINTRLAENDEALKLSPYTYRDIRDDRVLTYFNIREAQTLTYRVLLNAAYLGKYYLPPVVSEAMYDNTIQAGTTGKWVVVN